MILSIQNSANANVLYVLIKGVDDGNKTTKAQDYKEVLLNAKIEAIEKAGVEIKSILELENYNNDVS